MNVRGAIPFLTAVIVIICCTSGCTDSQAAVSLPSGVEGGVTDITSDGPDTKVRLDEALAALDAWQADLPPGDSVAAVYQVLGAGVETDGRARGWVLGVRQGDTPRWLAYGREGIQKISLSAPLPAEEIAFPDVVMPEGLYEQNRMVIDDTLRRHGTDTADLALTAGEYVLTIRSGAEFETLVFGAATGEAIPSV